MSTLTETAPAAAASAAEIARLTEICRRAAAGDLEARITGLEPDSPLAALSHEINRMLDIADSFVREASAAMKECSQERFHRPILLRGLHGSYRQSAATINEAGLKMKDSSAQIAFVGRMAQDNVAKAQTVAAACEELSVTTDEISRQARAATEQTETAVGEVRQATDAVVALNAAAKKIDAVVTLINKVAGQTNLLALNATIEAARAGEAGRGFAVVANEVKELSRNTRKATEEISGEVEAMQRHAAAVGKTIGGLQAAIGRVSDNATTIARQVAEQVTATREISQSIAGVADNTKQVSARITHGQA